MKYYKNYKYFDNMYHRDIMSNRKRKFHIYRWRLYLMLGLFDLELRCIEHKERIRRAMPKNFRIITSKQYYRIWLHWDRDMTYKAFKPIWRIK